MAEKEETRRLLGVGPAMPGFSKSDMRVKKVMPGFKEVKGVIPCGHEAMKTYRSVVGTASSEEEFPEYEPVIGYPVPSFPAEPRRAWNWLRLLPFLRPDREPILPGKPLKVRLEDFIIRRKIHCSQIRDASHKIMLQCLEWYNSKHPDDEYEPAPGGMSRRSEYNKFFWTHGNFVARRKRSGCFSFLPAPRTLFFFELRARDGANEVVTCTPIDEPVTEAYTFLGFPLGWGTRRYGGADCVCKTCYRQFHVPHIGLKRTCPCGDSKVESVCKMCYLDSSVLHPIRGGFTFGQESFSKIRW